MINFQYPVLEGDITRLRNQIYKTRLKTLPLIRQMYNQNLGDPKKSVDLNNACLKMKWHILELGSLIDEQMGQLNNLRAPKGHGQYKYYERQQFHGKVGSLNDTLVRLKQGLNELLREMDQFKFGTVDFLNKQKELETYELIDHVDAVKLSDGDFIEQMDIINATIVLVILVIKTLRRK